MQNIIQHTRNRLASYLGNDVEAYVPAPIEQNYTRFVQKIPAQNYQKLPRLVPISWL